MKIGTPAIKLSVQTAGMIMWAQHVCNGGKLEKGVRNYIAIIYPLTRCVHGRNETSFENIKQTNAEERGKWIIKEKEKSLPSPTAWAWISTLGSGTDAAWHWWRKPWSYTSRNCQRRILPLCSAAWKSLRTCPCCIFFFFSHMRPKINNTRTLYVYILYIDRSIHI